MIVDTLIVVGWGTYNVQSVERTVVFWVKNFVWNEKNGKTHARTKKKKEQTILLRLELYNETATKQNPKKHRQPQNALQHRNHAVCLRYIWHSLPAGPFLRPNRQLSTELVGACGMFKRKQRNQPSGDPYSVNYASQLVPTLKEETSVF